MTQGRLYYCKRLTSSIWPSERVHPHALSALSKCSNSRNSPIEYSLISREQARKLLQVFEYNARNTCVLSCKQISLKYELLTIHSTEMHVVLLAR